ncbi:FAD:protein FMN transferase [Bacteroidia bacterium]|nr:FAD:protein FMN transferase [Bacteroidia bacterium]
MQTTSQPLPQKRLLVLTLLLCAVSLLTAMLANYWRSSRIGIQEVHFMGEAQGTYYAITYFDTLGRNLQPQVDSILQAFDKVASLWDTASEINAVNHNRDIELSPMFQDLFHKSMEISVLTDGAFDITVGPLVKAYGFWNQEQEDLTDEKIAHYLRLVGYQKVRIENNRFIKDIPDIQIDFNAIAQGYSADVLSQFFENQSIYNYLIDVGGEIIANGQKPNGSHWVVGIEVPAQNKDDDRTIFTKIELKDRSIVTSGNYRKYYEKDGKRYAHTIDPKTGKPAEHNLLSVSVIDSTAWRADALATAMMVLGVQQAQQLAQRIQGLETYFICAEGTELRLLR